MARIVADRLPGGSSVLGDARGLLLALLLLNYACQATAAPPASEQTVPLTEQQQQILKDARGELQKSSLSEAEQQVRLKAVEAVLPGTVGVPDADNPEVRNPHHWTLTDDGYVVAPHSTPVEAIADLWIVHDNDGVPVPRIWCLKYTSLVLAKAHIQYFKDTGNSAGLAAMNNLIGHGVFPADLPNAGEGVLWKRRSGNSDLLPGDQVWFDNPYFDRGRELLRQNAYAEALKEGRPPDEAAKLAEQTADDLAAGEEGSNVFYLGNNRLSRGALSVVRIFCGNEQDSRTGYDQIYTKKIFTMPRYQQHIIDGFYTVQAYQDAHPGQLQSRERSGGQAFLPVIFGPAQPDKNVWPPETRDFAVTLAAPPGAVRCSDFQIKRVRSLVHPAAVIKFDADANRTRQLDRLIDAMASRNKEPQLFERGGRRIPRFAADYDWPEQQRVRTALLAVMKDRSDALWWRLRDRAGDKRYVLTASFNESAENFTVGSFCCDLALANLSAAYRRHLPAVPGRLPARFHPEDVFWKNEPDWARSCKPLYEMQIEVCLRALQQWPSVDGTILGKEGRRHTYTADEKQRFVAAVNKEIEELRRLKRPVFIETILHGVAAPSGWEGFDAESAKDAARELAPGAKGVRVQGEP